MQKVNMRSAEWTQGKQDRHMGIGKWRVAHLACEYREGGRKKQVTGGGSNVAAENERELDRKSQIDFWRQKNPTIHRETGAVLLEG